MLRVNCQRETTNSDEIPKGTKKGAGDKGWVGQSVNFHCEMD
jgi:hypothetical protein